MFHAHAEMFTLMGENFLPKRKQREEKGMVFLQEKVAFKMLPPFNIAQNIRSVSVSLKDVIQNYSFLHSKISLKELITW